MKMPLTRSVVLKVLEKQILRLYPRTKIGGQGPGISILVSPLGDSAVQ